MGQCLQYVPGMCLSARLWIGYCTGNHCLCYKKIAAAQTPLCMCGVCGCCISQFTHSGFHHRRAAVHSPLELNNVLFLINICSCTNDELYYILYLYGFEFCSRVYIFYLHFCVLQSYNKPRLDPNLHNFLLKNKAFGVDDCKAHHFWYIPFHYKVVLMEKLTNLFFFFLLQKPLWIQFSNNQWWLYHLWKNPFLF